MRRKRWRFAAFICNAVADFGLGLFVVGVELFVPSHDFLVFGMGIAAFDANDNRLGHLIGDDFADALLAFGSGDFGTGRGGGSCFSHTKFYAALLRI